MVQKSTKRGRPPGFQVDEVVDEMVRLFWERGYERVSLQELETRTGLNRSSLYNTFGSKQALFARALDRYLNEVAGRMLVPLEKGTAGIADLQLFVDRLTEWASGPTAGAGCLMVNSMVELGGADGRVTVEACSYVERFRAAATATLERAARLGEITPATVEAQVDLLVGMILGINVAARSGVPGLAGRLVEAVRVEVASWREENRPRVE